MSPVELRMRFADLGALEREIAQNLKHGRAFLSEAADVQVLSDCTLVLTHPEHGAELRLPAYVVMVSADGPLRGTGLEMRPWGPAVLAQVEAFVHAPGPEPAAAEEEPASAENQALETSDATASFEEAESGSLGVEARDEHQEADAGTDADEGDAELDAELASEQRALPSDVQRENKRHRLQQLKVTEQLKIARTGELSDRIVVERLYGKQVWEALLNNPRLTVPEVARIARKGTVPKPLLEIIVDNSAWTKTPQVRRALLSNPKIGTEAIGRLLRATPRHELKLIEKGTAYAMPVREAARKLLKQKE